jgi:hypothetical protein
VAALRSVAFAPQNQGGCWPTKTAAAGTEFSEPCSLTLFFSYQSYLSAAHYLRVHPRRCGSPTLAQTDTLARGFGFVLRASVARALVVEPLRVRFFSMASIAAMTEAATEAAMAAAAVAPAMRKSKLHGRAFYESIGSPKYIIAPMVDQSEFVSQPACPCARR